MITPPGGQSDVGWFGSPGQFVGPWFNSPGWFESEEARRFGARVRWPFTFFPHYFLSGLGSGSGAFVNCAWVAPDRVQVEPAAASASWTGPDQQGTVGRYPASVTLTWRDNLTGHSRTVEYKTAAAPGALAAAPWQPAINGQTCNLYQWYKFRVSWTGRRCLAQEVIDPENQRAAFATETPGGPHASFATEGAGGPTYLEALTLEGEFPISARDVVPQGQVSQQVPRDFSDLGASDYTLMLQETSGLYDYRSPNFLFRGETNWWGKNLRAGFGYQRPGTKIIDALDFYKGRIMRWGRPGLEVDDTGKPTFPQVEIYSRDLTALLLNQMIGSPDSEGIPRPFVRGRVVAQADELTDANPLAPVKTADFETGDLSQLSGSETTAHGTVTVSPAWPYRGSYGCRTVVANAANERALAKMSLAVPSDIIFASAVMYVAGMPAVPEAKATRLAGITDHAGTDRVAIYVDSDTRLWVAYKNDYHDTDTFLAAFREQHCRLSIGLVRGSNGLLKVWLGGEEIYSAAENFSNIPDTYTAWFGVKTGVAAETWDIHWDNLGVWNAWNPAMYQVYGGPYQAIKAMYVDGVSSPQEIPRRSKRQKSLDKKLKDKIRKGRKAGSANYITYPELGAVAWLDWANPPGGQIRLELVKDDLSNPADLVAEVITACGLADKINYDRFAAVKAALPADSIGVFFEDITAAGAIKEICSSCLLYFWMDQGVFNLRAYTGEPLSDPVLELNRGARRRLSGGLNMEDLTPRVSGIWGWADRNPDLRSEVSDPQLLALLGDNNEELDFSWGRPVMSDNTEMVRRKVALLFQRLSVPPEEVECEGWGPWLRLEFGDCVSLDGGLFEVYAKTITVGVLPVTTVGLDRYLGVS